VETVRAPTIRWTQSCKRLNVGYWHKAVNALAVAAAVLTVVIIITPVLTSSIREYTCDYERASVQQPAAGNHWELMPHPAVSSLNSDLIARTLCPELSLLLLWDVQP
jgi:hypothetical protein